MARTPRAPKTLEEAKQFLEGLPRSEDSFYLGCTLDVNRYGSRISRGESYNLSFYGRLAKGVDFHAHSIEALLQQFIEWKVQQDRPLPPAKAAIGHTPVRRLENKPLKSVASLWGEDPKL